jgi:hypothetical protein
VLRALCLFDEFCLLELVGTGALWVLLSLLDWFCLGVVGAGVLCVLRALSDDFCGV